MPKTEVEISNATKNGTHFIGYETYHEKRADCACNKEDEYLICYLHEKPKKSHFRKWTRRKNPFMK